MSETVPTIEFVAAMPGFPDRRKFVLVRLDDEGLLYALTSIDDPGLRFLVAPPVPFFPDYAPEIDDETLDLLNVHDPERLLILLVVTASEGSGEVYANLLAPIIIDRESRRAIQAVLTGSGLPIRAKLTAPA